MRKLYVEGTSSQSVHNFHVYKYLFFLLSNNDPSSRLFIRLRFVILFAVLEITRDSMEASLTPAPLPQCEESVVHFSV